MVRFASALTLACSLCFGAACDDEAEKPNAGKMNKERTEAPADESAKTKKVEASKATPEIEIKAGMEAKQVVALMSHPDHDFGGTEGEACFGYADQPDRSYCFSLKTEQATWAQVFGENYLVSEVRPRDPEESARAEPIKKPVLAEPDSKEDGR
jgi:hypothetical protein